ncbi:MAG: hypothetical protein ACK4VM_19250, partial [Bosea sp. (in: a-proteobacteria)]
LDALATSLSRDGGEDGVDARELFAAPEEISLRMLGRLVAAVADEPTPPRLDRLEQCHDALRAAAGERAALTRTLAGCVISLDRSGRLRLHREGPRKRGVHPATS